MTVGVATLTIRTTTELNTLTINRSANFVFATGGYATRIRSTLTVHADGALRTSLRVTSGRLTLTVLANAIARTVFVALASFVTRTLAIFARLASRTLQRSTGVGLTFVGLALTSALARVSFARIFDTRTILASLS